MDVCSKKNSAEDENENGQTWIWTGIDAKTRLMVHFLMGDRTEESGRAFLMELTNRLNQDKPLFTFDELKAYATLIKEAYHDMKEVEKTGEPGRPPKPQCVSHDDLDYATVHKTRSKGRVVKVEKKIIYGDKDRIERCLKDSPSHTVNNSFVERMNGILRQMNAHLRRKSLTFAKRIKFLAAKLNLVIAFYNFDRPHGTLSRNHDRSYSPRTPAMVAGLTDHPWSVIELIGTPQLQ